MSTEEAAYQFRSYAMNVQISPSPDEVRAELRRVALHGVRPWHELRGSPFWHARDFCAKDQSMLDLPTDGLRVFFLLVAEAL